MFFKVGIEPAIKTGALCVGIAKFVRLETVKTWTEPFSEFADRVFEGEKIRLQYPIQTDTGVNKSKPLSDFRVAPGPTRTGPGKNSTNRSGENASNFTNILAYIFKFVRRTVFFGRSRRP